MEGVEIASQGNRSHFITAAKTFLGSVSWFTETQGLSFPFWLDCGVVICRWELVPVLTGFSLLYTCCYRTCGFPDFSNAFLPLSFASSLAMSGAGEGSLPRLRHKFVVSP